MQAQIAPSGIFCLSLPTLDYSRKVSGPFDKSSLSSHVTFVTLRIVVAAVIDMLSPSSLVPLPVSISSQLLPPLSLAILASAPHSAASSRETTFAPLKFDSKSCSARFDVQRSA